MEEEHIPTPEERAANHRSLMKMSRADRFRLMFGQPLLQETTMKIGQTVICNLTGKEGTVEQYLPGGEKASDIFHSPMCVVSGFDEWLPASQFKPKEDVKAS